MDAKKRVRDDSDELELESTESKRFRDDLLEFLDDSDHTPSSIQDLDSVMKSLEEEISASTSPAVTSDSGESQAQIGYLLEASDDELGLPPPGDSSVLEKKSEETELVRVLSDSSELWEFEDRIPSYDSFDLGNTGFGYYDDNNNSNITEYVPFDGLFNHSDLYYDSADFTESCRHGTLPAR